MSAAGIPAAAQLREQVRRLRRVAADEQAAGGDEAERVGAQQSADALRLVRDGDAVAVDEDAAAVAAASSRSAAASPPSVTSCIARTPAKPRARRASGQDARPLLQCAAGGQLLRGHAEVAEPLAELLGEQRRALQRQLLGEQHAVAGARRALVLELGAAERARAR